MLKRYLDFVFDTVCIWPLRSVFVFVYVRALHLKGVHLKYWARAAGVVQKRSPRGRTVLTMDRREPPERAAPSMMHEEVLATERRGGARVAGDERTQPLVENECVVCPATLGDVRKSIPRDMIAMSRCTDLPPMFCCSSACLNGLRADKRARKDGRAARIVLLHRAWETSMLGTSLRPGDLVHVFKNSTPGFKVEGGSASISTITFNPETPGRANIVVVYFIGSRKERLLPSGLMPLPRADLSPRRITPPKTAATADATPYTTALIAAHQMRAVTDAQLARSATTIRAWKAKASDFLHGREEERVKRKVAEAGAASARASIGHIWHRSQLELAEKQNETDAASAEVEHLRISKAAALKNAKAAVAEARRISNSAQASLARCEANVSSLVGDSMVAMTAEEQRGLCLESAMLDATAERDAATHERDTLAAELAGRDERSLTSLVKYLVTDGSATSLLSKRGFDALVTFGNAPPCCASLGGSAR
jgi:hypothetical protein